MNDPVMVTFTIYDATGALGAIISCPDVDADANTPPGCSRIDGAWDGRVYWISSGEPTLRTPMAPVVAGRTISNLPIPCVATIEGVRYTIDDGVLELSAALPGPYVVSLDAVPFLPCEVVVE
jgi:hypothetical protein